MFAVTNPDTFQATVDDHKLSDVQAVYGPDRLTVIAYSGIRMLRERSGRMTQVFDVITLDGRYLSKGYKSRGPVTSWVRKNRQVVASVVEETAQTPAVGALAAVPAETPAQEDESAAETSARVLAGMPRNAGVIFHEAAELGWDVRAERRWTGRTWARVVVITGLVMVRAGVEEREHLCAWSEGKGSYLGSVSSDGFKAVREAINGTRPVNREYESAGRTVWGRDAAEWVRQMDGAVSKVMASFADTRDAFNALDGTTPMGARAVALASAAYSEAREAERSAVDAGLEGRQRGTTPGARGSASPAPGSLTGRTARPAGRCAWAVGPGP
ncbi:hypothetical protein [Streptomyces sp. NPDC015125]|uniref:hypothetical protein n=1 Tax=Streptomyces sp. NPDC015125 TaxID=3364938 RepID=UPI0036F8F523